MTHRAAVQLRASLAARFRRVRARALSVRGVRGVGRLRALAGGDPRRRSERSSGAARRLPQALRGALGAPPCRSCRRHDSRVPAAARFDGRR